MKTIKDLDEEIRKIRYLKGEPHHLDIKLCKALEDWKADIIERDKIIDAFIYGYDSEEGTHDFVSSGILKVLNSLKKQLNSGGENTDILLKEGRNEVNNE